MIVEGLEFGPERCGEGFRGHGDGKLALGIDELAVIGEGAEGEKIGEHEPIHVLKYSRTKVAQIKQGGK